MKDILQQELQTGDKVFWWEGNKYHQYHIARINRFTPKKVGIEILASTKPRHFTTPQTTTPEWTQRAGPYIREVITIPQRLIKLTPNQATQYPHNYNQEIRIIITARDDTLIDTNS